MIFRGVTGNVKLLKKLLKRKADHPVRFFLVVLALAPCCVPPLPASDAHSSSPAPPPPLPFPLLTFRAVHMGTRFTIRFWVDSGGGDDDRAHQAASAAFAEIARLEQVFSDYRPDSEITRLAQAPAGEPVPVGTDLYRLFERAEHLHRRTEGAFDITAGPFIRAWRLSRKNHRVPTPEQLANARARSGFSLIELDPVARTIRKRSANMIFDAGGIAKGIAADAALEILREHGFPRALVAASGDIALGDPPPGAPGWKVGLESLDETGAREQLRAIVLANAAVSTSGDTRQYVEIGGVRYSHIVDPETGLGLTERISVTVVAPDATTSDSHATAVSILGERRGLQFVRNTRGVECRVVTLDDQGQERYAHTDGFPEYSPIENEEE